MSVRDMNKKCYLTITDGLTGHFKCVDITDLSLNTVECIIEDLVESSIRNREDFRISFGYEP